MSQLALELIAENIRTKNPVLDLGNCGLTELYPKLLDKLALTGEWLEELILSSDWMDWETDERKYSQNRENENQIEQLPILPYFKKLKILVACGLNFADCSWLMNCITLNTLDISRNKIKDCLTLTNLTNLNKLFISMNQITDCSPLANLKQLQILYMWINEVNDTTPLANLTQLRKLNIGGNKISNLAPICNLSQLNELFIWENRINDCTQLTNLTALNRLIIHGNEITDCSPLTDLTSLEILDIHNNQISDFTPLLPLIKKGVRIKLEWGDEPGLYLYGNPITNPPLEIWEQGNEAVIRYFESGQLRPLNECKLIFVGDGGVGKTSLMRRLVGQDFNPDEQTTHGINKIAWRGITNAQNEAIRVNLWDFGGQHIQHSLHQFFFTERVIYVLVLNPRNDEKAGYWLDQIAALGKESQVLVVYNWKDDKDANYLNNFYELRKKYSQLAEPFLLSCKTGDGLPSLKKAIRKAVLNHEGQKVQYPAKWFNIKARLERDIPVDTSYIGYDTYQQWCNEADYTDPDAQKGLLKILDSIGSIVFFDKPVLNEYPVLNPEWITTGAYAILVASQTKDKQGHLNWSDLKAIFKEKKSLFSDKEIQIQFTEKQIYFILELMLSYNLCQKNPFAPNEYLIPAAFGEQPGKDYGQGKAGARHYRIRFQSPFEMLIIHRFIAKNLLKITDKDYWQSGIYIKHPGSQTFALVETNQYSQEINCWIKGDNVRGFWEVIRNDFNEILSMYHNLPYEEEVLYEKDGKLIFLSYNEMLMAYKNGVLIIPYHPVFQIRDINVADVLEQFEVMPQTHAKMVIESIDSLKKMRDKIIEQNKMGNIGRAEVFFSYKWKDATDEAREDIVDAFYNTLSIDMQEQIFTHRDRQDVKYGDSISDYMKRIGRGRHIFVFISDKYLRSPYCMYELHLAYAANCSDTNLLKEVIYPIRVESISLSKPSTRKSYADYWKKEIADLELYVNEEPNNRTDSAEELKKIRRIREDLDRLLLFLVDICTPDTIELQSNNFEQVKAEIQRRLNG